MPERNLCTLSATHRALDPLFWLGATKIVSLTFGRAAQLSQGREVASAGDPTDTDLRQLPGSTRVPDLRDHKARDTRHLGRNDTY